MAIFAHPVAMDDPPMTQRQRNAAIYFASDGYDPAGRGINGRRVAGESFLRGFLRHADVAEFVPLTPRSEDQALFARIAAEERPRVAVRPVPMRHVQQMAPLGTLFYPSPNFAAETWRRAPFGQAAWSICGITHTISTKGVMQGFHDLRMAPQAEWDAVICTSRAVLAAVLHQFELIDAHATMRFGAPPPARPQTPVIPLGVDCAAFAPDAAAGQGLRQRLGIGPDDVVFATIARLSPHEKFDPLPLYIALAAAQAQMPPGCRVHLVLCGIFREQYSRGVFEKGATGLMPAVGFHLLDGADPAERKAVLSGADVFVFAIDNIQETFGLAPIEAMAAGLPCLVSDWDGLRDTVTADVGIRVPTRTLAPRHAEQESFRHLTGVDSYAQYCALASAMTEIDLPALTEAIVALAVDPGLRARMGQAAQARARSVYDWANVIPQMQDLWAELALRRHAAQARAEAAIPRAALPVAPSPFAMFGAYPTRQGGLDEGRFVAADLTGRPGIAETFGLRNYAGLGRAPERAETLALVQARVAAAGALGLDLAEIDAQTGISGITLDRAVIWLLKYGFLRQI